MRRNDLALPYTNHKDRARSGYLTKSHNIDRLWETNIHCVNTVMMEWYISSQ